MKPTVHCAHCGALMSEKTGTHHFLESGLSNVYLENISIRECACGYSEVSLPAFMNLQEILCKALISSPYPLKGEEIKYIRSAMGFHAKDLAKRLSVSAVTVSRWENGKVRMNRANAYLLKMMVNSHFSRERKKFAKMLEDVSLTEEQAAKEIARQMESGKYDRKFLRFPLPFAGKKAQLALELTVDDCVPA